MLRKLAHICLRMLEILSQRVSNFKTLHGSIGLSVHIMHFITFSNHNPFIHITWKKNSCKPWHRKHYVGFNLCFCMCTWFFATVLAADPDIRFCVLSSLDERFDAHLAQAENLSALFVALNDEVCLIEKETYCTTMHCVHLQFIVIVFIYVDWYTVTFIWVGWSWLLLLTGVWNSWTCHLYNWKA